MQNWIPDIHAAQGPKYLAIAQALARDIEAGILSAGERLLPQRALAEALGVDLTTVTRAYGEAQRIGLIEGNGRRGSFVRARAARSPALGESDPGDVGMNAPPDAFGGTLKAAFLASAEALLTSEFTPAPFQYQRVGGSPAVRQVGAALLAQRSIPCEEDTVLVLAGGQNALHAIFSAELRPGDRLAVCPFAYPGLISLARRFGIGLHAVASDEQGMLPEALDAACASTPIRAVYLVPTNDNPTTSTMTVERRKAMAAMVEKHGLLLIEDDAYGLLPEQPLPPITSFAPDHGWHIASVSKILTPGLRVAWLRAPDVAKAWRLAADMHETAIMAPPLNAAVVADWVRSGVFQRLAGEVREEARQRQALARKCLPHGSFQSREEGYHLWIPLPEGADPRHIADALRQHGLSAIASDAFAVERSATIPALRVSIGGSISRERLQRGLLLLAALIGPEATRKISLV
ncbi:PLP-dependent aminotransferase family protein [Sphingobium estronivorans]|uniref:aminotransferase-like domain-containing protein n=1 Tax=Sphingobium estronivorans TaxID=1577690 RepID=UPI00123A791E|nr:PLP-dependent aminotransferase family protein [Sphingobium estronivorans]